MKGLLVKDMRMLLGQKKFGALIVFMTVVLSFNSDSYFVVYYLTFVCSFLAISSISYDENDNGYPFLFTLPIDRSSYVREKYLFGFILNLCSWLVGILVCGGFAVARNELSSFRENFALLLLVFLAMFVFDLLVFPLLFKFGSEKGRIVMLCVFLMIFFIGYILSTIVNYQNILVQLSGYPKAVLGALLLAVTAVILFVSYAVSVLIMKKKEF